jgi:hypothetical protein
MVTAEIRTPTTLLKAIFAFMRAKYNLESLPDDSQLIYSTFHELKESFPQMLKEFIFDNREMYPYCTVLDEALDNLQSSNILKRPNLDMKEFTISQPSDSYFSDVLKKKFSEEEINEIGRIAQSWVEKLHKHSESR